MAGEVTIGVLGPLEVRVGGGEPVEVVGPRQGGEDAHRGGLAGAVGAEHRQHRAGGGRKVGTGQRGGLAEALDQAFRLDRVGHVRSVLAGVWDGSILDRGAEPAVTPR
jgi:hypothetical protein